MSASRKILIVDDDDDLRNSLKDQLQRYEEFELADAIRGQRADGHACRPL